MIEKTTLQAFFHREKFLTICCVSVCKQLIIEFAKKESILIDGHCRAEVLLGRDTRPSGESLLEAAKQVKYCYQISYFSH